MTGGTHQVNHSPPLYQDQGATILPCSSQDTTAPPSYEEAINPNAPPPSYDSLFGRVREAQKTSKGVIEFLKNIIIIVLGTLGCTVILGVTIVIPICMIVMGLLYLYDCPQGEYIPVYLLVGGIFGVLKQLLHLSARVRQTEEERQEESLRQSPTQTLLNCFMLGWFIIVAKRKSLFDDRTAEIQELTYIIKGDLSSLNQQIAQLQDVSKKHKSYTTGKHLQSHSSSVVLALQSKLATMSTDFKQILEVRTENLKHQKSRREQFSQGGLPPPPVPSSSQGSLLLQEQDQVSINLEGSALVPQRTQMQAALMYDETDQYLQSRAETMQNIESTIVELGGIFQQLAHMVKEQEEMVERIDTNVQDAELNIEAAHAQILKYFQSVTSNRWLMIKIFGVLIFFFIFFVVFLA
ncbi:syntaxin-5 isoform X2 [Tribolium castaneum]|uniref:syntaxin-5 isoform X2 n=1 Tax=Tribolium castaneum TaxID=7070 RepID=UPI0030FF30A0